MTRGRGQAARSTVALLRESLVGLAALNTGGLAIELATLRHWKSPVQLIAWLAVVLLAVGAVLLTVFPSLRAVRAVRALAVSVMVISSVGVFEHVKANYETGPLDYHYAATWASMSVVARLWAALSKSVGPAPSFAPAALGIAALCLWLATVHHPVLPGVTDRFRAGRPSARLGDGAYKPAVHRARVVRTSSFAADLTTRRVTTPTGEVRLTPIEWRLLEVLTRHPGRTLSPAQLQREIWRAPAPGQLEHLAAAMSQLHRKLEPDPSRPRHLLHRPGAGYCFRPAHAAPAGRYQPGAGTHR